ncbi:histidine kinase [Campylobacter mucosalis]|uniref:Putative thioredoxin-like protein, DsbA family n=1 Tax=Campylobacter mucosalis CCUG 21559 TaxID=1032067 RepID=A0A6G5QF07_9BACT|nr:thioredoxin fold domain-containing protein [Campylobacter mucosalis]KEA46011.1 histidine kinase [Campylobacter mucosalis]QCD44232.1 putative thioredoxin-like protein, DsbA family [Campylobacter mucosalis CCUG 21559]QKF63571.1 protein disulfide isomerase, DsbG family [Campylobacter mucosalis]
MKKTLLFSVALANIAFGVSNEEIIKFYQQIVPEGIKVEVTSREKIAQFPEYESILINISDGQNSDTEVVFANKDLIFPDMFDLKNQKSFKGEIMENIMNKKLADTYKKEDSKNIISLGNDPKKPTVVIFSDPECPYCRAELKNTEKRLQTQNIKIILTSVHDTSALEKSYLIYKEVATAKSDSDKVKILRKYFAEDAKVPEKAVTEQQIEQMNALRTKYFSAGVKSVPKIVEEAKLK